MICVQAGELTSPPPVATTVCSPGRSASIWANCSATASSPARSSSTGVVARGEALDRRAGAVAPARPALAREQRQHRQPVGVGRHRGDRRARPPPGAGSCVRLAQPGDDAAAVRQRAAEQDPLARRRGSTTARAAARAPRRGRARAARRSCRPSAPRAPRVSQPAPRFEHRAVAPGREPRDVAPAPASARPTRRSGRSAARRRSAAACPRRPARRPARGPTGSGLVEQPGAGGHRDARRRRRRAGGAGRTRRARPRCARARTCPAAVSRSHASLAGQ